MSYGRRVRGEVNHLGPIRKGIPKPIALFPEDGEDFQNVVLKFVV